MQSTVGMDYKTKLITIDDSTVKLAIWVRRFCIEIPRKTELLYLNGYDIFYSHVFLRLSYCVVCSVQDTAGQERFRTLTPSYYRDGQGAILVFDVTDRNTFVKLETWVEELNTYCNKMDLVKMVVGNKIDLANREVSTEEALQFARRHKTLYIESSAKTADGIKCCFEELVQKVDGLLFFKKRHFYSSYYFFIQSL